MGKREDLVINFRILQFQIEKLFIQSQTNYNSSVITGYKKINQNVEWLTKKKVDEINDRLEDSHENLSDTPNRQPRF
jgi:hypothetical protein